MNPCDDRSHDGIEDKPRTADIGIGATIPVASIRPPQVPKSRTILTAEQAISIYQLKNAQNPHQMSQGARSAAVADAFRVSEKAVRDIWSGRTWAHETCKIETHLAETAKIGHSTGGLMSPADESRPNPTVSGRMQAFPKESSVRSAFSPAHAAAQGPLPHTTSIPPSLHSAYAVPGMERPPEARPGIAEPLPPPSRPDDPFHDDWPHWDLLAGPPAPPKDPGADEPEERPAWGVSVRNRRWP